MAYNPYNAVNGIVLSKQKWANAKAKGEDTTPYEQEAEAFYKELRDNGRSDVADYLGKSDAVQASTYLKNTFTPSYTADAASLQQKSNDIYGTTKGYADDIKTSYDNVYKNNINIDPTQTSYGKSILNAYGIGANEAYKSTLGGGASDNNGNVDSFAAANANRQKAAVLSQGYGDALNYYSTIADKAGAWAGDKATALSGFVNQLQGNLQSDRDVVTEAFKGTIDLQKNVNDNDTKKYESDNSLKGTTYTADKTLEGTKDTNATERYKSDNTLTGTKDTNATNLEGSKIAANADMYGYYVDGYNRVVTDALGNQKVVGNGTPAPNYLSLGSSGATGVEGNGVGNAGGNVGAGTVDAGTVTPVEGTTVTEDPAKVITHNMTDDKYYNGNGDEVTKDGKVKVYLDRMSLKYYTMGGKEVTPDVALGDGAVIVSLDDSADISTLGSSRVLPDGTVVDSHGQPIGKYDVGTGSGTGSGTGLGNADKVTTDATKGDAEAMKYVVQGSAMYNGILSTVKSYKSDADKAAYIIGLNQSGLPDAVARALFTDAGLDINKYIK